MQNRILVIIISVVVITSCTRYKDIVYLQKNKKTSDTTSIGFYPYQVPTYRIQKRDILYINILSMNREVAEIMNTIPASMSNPFSTESSFYIYGYNVDDSGYVEIPVVGKVMVLDKSLEEAKISIVEQTLKYLREPTVIVKLISFKYSVLGEVLKPGSYINYNNQLTVLEAISQAGDITAFGNRRKVMVIRPGVDGTKTIELNLTDAKILASEGFYLLPNDLVYITPLKSRNFRNNIPAISLVLGAITTTVFLLSYLYPPTR